MKDWHRILFLLFVFSFAPSDAYACTKNKCKKEMSDTKRQKSCCGTGDHSKNDHSGCNGKCGNSSCVNPAAPLAINLADIVEFESNPLTVVRMRPIFYYTQPRISSGYYTIWLIPKISLS